MDEPYLTIPGYLPAKVAALRVGLSTERLLQHARAGRLPSRIVEGRYLIPVEAIATFQRKPHGKIRTRPVPWRRFLQAEVYVRRIDAPIRPGQQEALRARLVELAEAQEHVFPGTASRFVSVEDGEISILLTWKTTEADEVILARDVEAFKAEIAPFVDWTRARDGTNRTLAHT